MTAEIRLTQANLEDKLSIQTFADKEETILRLCCECKAGIDAEHKPIHYTVKDLEKLGEMYKISHGYCKICANIIYSNNFGETYDQIHDGVKKDRK
jgi:hypothetical protein